MSIAYVDTSSLVAIAFGEPGEEKVRGTINESSRLISSNLLEAELRAAHVRRGRELTTSLMDRIDWIYPTRPLGPEFDIVLSAGYVRGADLWHLACALYVTNRPEELAFVTLDQRQREVAKALGFAT